MSIYIQNSLSRKKEEFLPLQSPHVSIYTCGVTVYDDCHIGHARSLYIFNVIRNYLKYRGFDVHFVRNITDIDDKIINRANELKTDWQELVKRYIERYYEDLKALGIEKADFEPRATENIPEMIQYIKTLINKECAYVTATGVYFRVRKFGAYGKLSGQGIDQMETGVRKDADETKDDPLDFALWKMSKPGEPFWPSPWGNGRPGWHIECSVMSQKFLKTDTLDIHAGGRDLIFPHHENEIAQAEALTGKPFAKYWIHHGLLTINGQKMSKSLGNFVTVKDFLARHKDPDILKLFFLSAHYSHPIDYTEEKISESIKQRIDFDNFFKTIFFKKGKTPFSEKDKLKIDGECEKFTKAMDDDFNMPLAVGAIFNLMNIGLQFIPQDKEESFVYTKSKLKDFLEIIGLRVPKEVVLTKEVQKSVEEMEIARNNKDFVSSDNIRQYLKLSGVIASTTASNIAITVMNPQDKQSS